MTNEERKNAIRCLKLWIEREPQIQTYKTCLEALKQTTWIPCSERLPEKNVEVLATTEWGEVTIAEIFGNGDWFIHEGATNAETDEIAAWMPLPQAYREVEE
jgi:hypothetical protein